jgi:hypothetical protein
MPDNMNEIIRGKAGRSTEPAKDNASKDAPAVPELLEQMQTVLDQLTEQLAEDDEQSAA